MPTIFSRVGGSVKYCWCLCLKSLPELDCFESFLSDSHKSNYQSNCHCSQANVKNDIQIGRYPLTLCRFLKSGRSILSDETFWNWAILFHLPLIPCLWLCSVVSLQPGMMNSLLWLLCIKSFKSLLLVQAQVKSFLPLWRYFNIQKWSSMLGLVPDCS